MLARRAAAGRRAGRREKRPRVDASADERICQPRLARDELLLRRRRRRRAELGGAPHAEARIASKLRHDNNLAPKVCVVIC